MRIDVQRGLSSLRGRVCFEHVGHHVRDNVVCAVPESSTCQFVMRRRFVRHHVQRWLRQLQRRSERWLRNGSHAPLELRCVRHDLRRNGTIVLDIPDRRLRLHDRMREPAHALRLDVCRHHGRRESLRLMHAGMQRRRQRIAHLHGGRMRVLMQHRLSRLRFELPRE